MLNPEDRKKVETVRNARSISIVVNGGFYDRCTVNMTNGKAEAKNKLIHDIAIALQDYFNNAY